MSLRTSLSEYQAAFQGELFPALEEAPGPLPERYGRFVLVLEFVLVLPAWPGRPPGDRRALARAFLAKAVFDVPTTRALIERLQIDEPLRRLCGCARGWWQRPWGIVWSGTSAGMLRRSRHGRGPRPQAPACARGCGGWGR